ncbi:hypothetical protein N869_05090 [Cellulomonas bogoriensis 69B4 = DSM 16987]|uniref:Uncharacterized protein n=1 Tax=Cellulomonas bogoriensis 69B4 = DSM 16987 TaxID=1386082 RepID=A0A0A0C3H2_9CELL|nr:hypothetical protein N869_05090 [Cellulomonas bogoriensis 69B4 = DSM 16987]
MIMMVPTSATAATTSLSGTVNCTGTRTVYNTVRTMAEPSRTDLFLTKAAGGARSGYSMYIGVYIVANGNYHRAYFASANRYGTLQSGNNYVVNTRFRMTAQMAQASRGTCSNSWGGTLTF